jgi:formiminotetrahydrofolate cyclodeaminase
MLADKTVRELLDAFSSPAPTPGGGSAAALSGAVAAALLAMVAGMPKTRNGTAEDRAALDAALPAVAALRAELMDLIDRDAAAYDLVVTAYRLPKATDADKAARQAAIRDAMRVATDVPMETARAAAALVALARTVAEHGNPSAKTDAAVAVQMAMTAFSGAMANVEVNLDAAGDETYAAAVRAELRRLTMFSGESLGPIYAALGWKGHTPPRS